MGDYWGYFVFTSRFYRSWKKSTAVGDYLARVNIFSLIPSLFLLVSFMKQKNPEKKVFVNYLFSRLFSFFEYMVFDKLPRISTGDTIKATYIIQMFNILVSRVIQTRRNSKKE